MTALSDQLYDAIMHQMNKGDEAFEKEAFDAALKHYERALALIPQPQTDWEIALHTYVALGDCYFNLDNYQATNDCYNRALLCPDGLECGYVRLSLGESLYKPNCIEKAKDSLMRAYMPEDEEIFDDDKYFDIIKNLI